MAQVKLPSCLVLLLVAFTFAKSNCHDAPTVDYGTFENPSSRVRARFRYWLPDPSVDKETVKANIKSAGSIGAGGVEFLPFYAYGGQIDRFPAGLGPDWSVYGFGTRPSNEMFKAALEAHKESGLKMDFALGPNQGQGVPAQADNEGLQWDLVPFVVPVPSNGTFNGVIPGWQTGELVAVVSALVLSEKSFWVVSQGLDGITNVTWSEKLVRNGTLNEVTSQVSPSTGRVELSFPETSNGTSYWLFSFYQKLSLQKNLLFDSNRSATIWDNGSYIVDHYSARGAKVVTDFWEKYILTDEVRALLADVGNYAWEDSIEATSNISWTPSFPQMFEDRHGYSIKPYLPLIIFQNNNIGIQRSDPGSIHCVLDTEDQGLGYINDFRKTLEDGYRQYLQAFTNWTRQELNLQLSAQPSYNLPMDMEASIPYVDAPECESLGFLNKIDAYRQFSGAANLAGKRVISNEMGAEILKAYAYTIPELLFSFNIAVAGGINQVVLHGQSYTGTYPETTWPGYTAFSYLFSELYSEKQPAWYHGFSEAIEYMSRIQHIQQQGVPRTDVGVYNKQSATDVSFPTIYGAVDLEREAFTYSYVSPENFNLPQAFVKDGILAPDGPAWKALVVESSQNLSIDAVSHLEKFAKAGLPIIISGGSPGYYPSKNSQDTISFQKKLSTLMNSTNVYTVATGDVANKLFSLGLMPQIQTETNGTTWYSTWREDNGSGKDYAFIFNNGPVSSGSIIVKSAKIPYLFDPWSGSKSPVLNYQTNGSITRIPLTLAPNGTALLGFSDEEIDGVSTPSCHATYAPSAIVGYSPAPSGLILKAVESSSQCAVSLSTNKTITIAPNAAPPFSLSNWTLVAEHWEAPSNFSDASVVAVKHNTTHSLSSLQSWTNIPALVNTSGIGYYTTSFNWSVSEDKTSSGAYISFSRIVHAARVYINGNKVPAFDYTNPTADISPYLDNGKNEVLVVVPTTMWNYIRTVMPKIRSMGSKSVLETVVERNGGDVFLAVPATENGLVGTVTVVPYTKVFVSC